ncbi:MAG: tetratricopeptide repeat protein [Pseudomonadota bacterium]
MRYLIVVALLALPIDAHAKGDDETSPPKTTKTTKQCLGVRVWDSAKKRCVRPKQSELNDDLLYDAVRELAYAGRYLDAQGVMDAMADQASDRVLTYRGFTARKLGDLSLANVHYEMAIALNPDNIAARSYMGQGFVEAGDKVAALMQLREIQARGGQGTWAEVSLRQAIETGTGYNY